ncbi:MAG TPA: hypothetical protein VKU00_16175, partial [Chthonomonadaceae bacterium]|nr:hypothetical protein [Chthonomonadaceae bacterium]
VQALLTYEAACKKGDIAGAKRLATPAATEEWDALIAKLGSAAFRKLMQENTPDGKTRLKQITHVVVRGDQATVLFKEEGGLSWQPMVKKNKVWLIDSH